jgi:hypothetical protein
MPDLRCRQCRLCAVLCLPRKANRGLILHILDVRHILRKSTTIDSSSALVGIRSCCKAKADNSSTPNVGQEKFLNSVLARLD